MNQSTKNQTTKLRGYVSLGGEFRSGKITPRSYLDESLKRIAELDKDIGAFIITNPEGGRLTPSVVASELA